MSEASSALYKLIKEAWRHKSLISITIGDSLLYVLYKYIFCINNFFGVWQKDRDLILLYNRDLHSHSWKAQRIHHKSAG